MSVRRHGQRYRRSGQSPWRKYEGRPDPAVRSGGRNDWVGECGDSGRPRPRSVCVANNVAPLFCERRRAPDSTLLLPAHEAGNEQRVAGPELRGLGEDLPQLLFEAFRQRALRPRKREGKEKAREDGAAERGKEKSKGKKGKERERKGKKGKERERKACHERVRVAQQLERVLDVINALPLPVREYS